MILYWKILRNLFCFCFTWQLYGIIYEWIHPSQQTTDIREMKLINMDFPVIFKICINPSFNQAAIREEGYAGVKTYFRGRSRFNSSIYGWAGHTNTSEPRDTVDNIYKKILDFHEPEQFLKK